MKKSVKNRLFNDFTYNSFQFWFFNILLYIQCQEIPLIY